MKKIRITTDLQEDGTKYFFYLSTGRIELYYEDATVLAKGLEALGIEMVWE